MLSSTYSSPWSPSPSSENEYSDPTSSSSDYHDLVRTSNSRGEMVYKNNNRTVLSHASSAELLYKNVGNSNKTMLSNASSGFEDFLDESGIDLDARTNVYCIHKLEGCRWHGPLGKLKAHLNTCQRDAVACPRGQQVCSAKIARQLVDDHLSTTCPGRTITCPKCRSSFIALDSEKHLLTCPMEPVDCENKCGMKIQRCKLIQHKRNTCSKRIVGCEYCGEGFSAETVREHHKKCGACPVPCPNRCTSSDGALISIPRDDLELHIQQDCGKISNKSSKNDNTLTRPCSFEDAGCQFRSGCRSEMESHVRDASKLHLDLMCSLVERQRLQIDRLSNQLEKATTSYNGVLVWKVRDLSSRMREAKSSEGLELVSVPFFTSQCGYRLQASLFLDGNGSGEGRFMSAYIKILPGEFDSILKWPFRHTVSFSLLDQSEDRSTACNVVESFLPDPNWPNFRRPSPQSQDSASQLGFGFPKFVPHSMLFDSKRKYVKDDCVFVKIRVDPARNVAV